MPRPRGKRYPILRVPAGSVRVLLLSEEILGISTYWAGRRRVSFDRDVNAEPRDPTLQWRGYVSAIYLRTGPGPVEVDPEKKVILELTEEGGRQLQNLIDNNGETARGMVVTLGRRHSRAPVWARETTAEDRPPLPTELPEADDVEDAVRRIYRVDWERE